MTLKYFFDEWNDGRETVTVRTSGSTGKPKVMEVEKRRMLASARVTCDFLGLRQGDTALLCMSLDYIAGKMMVVRSIERGLRVLTVEPSGHPMRGLTEATDLVAMVPMQVYNTLKVESERRLLMQSRHLLIGGGAIDKELEAALQDFPNAVWSTYGMTETLSHIALRRINGKEASLWYVPFDTVEVRQNADGCLVIDAPEICSETLTTNDIVEMNADGRRFRIIGRRDNVICSGGVKIQIEEVEALLKEHVNVPFVITKCRDEKFGEAVVMLYESGEQNFATTVAEGNENGADRCDSLRRVAESVLPQYWRPKHYFAVDCLPVTGTGKPARKQAELLAESARLNLCEDSTAE